MQVKGRGKRAPTQRRSLKDRRALNARMAERGPNVSPFATHRRIEVGSQVSLGLPCLVWLDGTRRGRIARHGCVAMDSDLVRKCPLSVITMRLNAELCNGHGTFPDKFSNQRPVLSDSFWRGRRGEIR